MMWGKQKKLECLFDELRGIAVLERLNDIRTDLAEDDPYAHELRRNRQSELLAEIGRLNPTTPSP
jgi:hypothetical protein